ncbi:ankyrin-like protein [Vaccinia virus]|uniref:Ankyrin-like protein n=1 Tax=Vaccinia virus TaxID=10245 RepID=A0A2I6TE48_VACCV|nr:ankyrin-like protein [Vaccinia virus]QCI57217.1 ankyrin-like protein [Vaccinia virus]QCI57414.1 ankyrin-like protein [Vaccinia virus]QCI57609.1 ankyrin-like protein [Vaccinia virus]QCI57809.1 ankyrin-like protein [Vaccinia virus]
MNNYYYYLYRICAITRLSRYLYLTDREHINVDSIKQLCKISDPNRCGCTALEMSSLKYVISTEHIYIIILLLLV